MKITNEIYKNNLLFYTLLKKIVQCKLSEKRMTELKQLIQENSNLNRSSFIEHLKTKVVKDTSKNYENYLDLLSLCSDENYTAWVEIIDLALELLMIKPLLLDEGKTYVNKNYENASSTIKDRLSLAYDSINLEKPYGQRVVSAILVYGVTGKNRKKEFVLESSGEAVRDLSKKIEKIQNKYEINTNNIFMIIMDESVNQSVISTAGNSYEERVESKLRGISDEVSLRKHDSRIPSVEYDFTFRFNDKLYGVSAKRTLRERYKQNFEDVDLLAVDAVFIVTLGTDLNQDKLTNILQRRGYFVVVASEVYHANEYFINNRRVISSDKFDKKNLGKLLSKYV